MKNKLNLYFWINHIFFTIGLLFINVLIHEFIHYLQCGGNFISGFYYINNEIGVGITYCKNGNSSEILAYSISFLFIIPIFLFKIFKDKIA